MFADVLIVLAAGVIFGGLLEFLTLDRATRARLAAERKARNRAAQ